MLIRGGLAIKRMRNARGYSQERLAREYGSGKNTIGNWELGRNEPPFLTVFEIGIHLGFKIEEIYAIANDKQLSDDQASKGRAA